MLKPSGWAPGFALVEMAIALVIIGLLVGAMLKGQELVVGARVRALISQHDEFRAALLGFTSRYGTMPGDYAMAATHIGCATTCLNGNGNQRLEDNAAPANGSEVHEDILAWTHLSAAGFLNIGLNMSAGESIPTDANTPRNRYGGFWKVVFDGQFGTVPTGALRHNLKTGPQIPAGILSEVDRKVDDGLPNSGTFRFCDYASPGAAAPVGGSPGAASCTSAALPDATWNVLNGSENCGAAALL